MIKQSWNIDFDEKIRILKLHENATKNQYLIVEQDPKVAREVTTTTPPTTTTTTFPVTNLGDKFPMGQYESDEVKQQIINLKPQIEEFIKNSNSSKFNLNITAGESQITNPKNFSTKGSLALERANTVKKYFQEYYKDLIDNGTLTITSPNSVDDVSIGKTLYYKGSAQSDHPNKEQRKWYLDNVKNYKNEQFVNFTITGSGQKTTQTTVTNYICDYKAEAGGGYAKKEANFIHQSKTLDLKNLPDGTKLKIHLITYSVPDLLLVQAGAKTYSTGWVGESGGGIIPRILFATVLGNSFGLQPPSPFPQDIVELDYKTAHYWFDDYTNMKDTLGHVVDINWKKNIPKQVDQIKWYNFKKDPFVSSKVDDDAPAGLGSNRGGKTLTIIKDSSFDSLTYYIYSPLGNTAWNLYISCG